MPTNNGRQFGVITDLTGTTVSGCVLNNLTTGTSAQKAEARNEKGKVTDIWYYSKEKTISVRGVLDAQTLSQEAGSAIILRGSTYGINSTSVDENHTAAASFSIDASTSDNATIHEYAADTPAQTSGTGT